MSASTVLATFRPHWRFSDCKSPAFWGRGLVASIWIYQGLVCKVFAQSPHHLTVFQTATGLAPDWARLALCALGFLETVLAVWVLTRYRPRLAALTQTLLLVGMNGAGLLSAAEKIPDPVGMIGTNLLLVALIWMLAIPQREVTHAAP